MLGVPELEKRVGEPCAHVCSSGCGIYADRPGSCRTFECQWLRGLLEVDGSVDPALRPDACGVIFDYQPRTPSGDVYVAWEVVPGAASSEPAKRILEGLEERFPVIVMRARASGGTSGLDHPFADG